MRGARNAWRSFSPLGKRGAMDLMQKTPFFLRSCINILREGKNGVRKQKFNEKEKTEGFQRQYRYFCTEKIAKG
jgi:hypothetical protein